MKLSVSWSQTPSTDTSKGAKEGHHASAAASLYFLYFFWIEADLDN